MIIRLLTFLVFIALCSLPCLANAATYNWYFSNSAAGNTVGNDTTGDGSIGNPWKTLQKAENVMKVKNNDDVVNLYFDRGDTWNFATNVLEVFSVETGDPVVHIKAYGSGNRPILQGDISDFSTADVDGDNGYNRYNRVFNFEVENCSIDNVEIKDAYGVGVFLRDADGFTLSNSLIHNVGASFIDTKSSPGAENVTVEYNVLHTGMQLHLYDLYDVEIPRFSQGVSLFSENGGPFRNNLVQYNLVYDVAGEGISAPNSIIQYNVVGDTSSTGIDSSPAAWDASTGVVRYNLVMMSDWSSSDYDNLEGSPNGIRIFDENVGGDNSGADISVYGNIIINRYAGIWVFSSLDTENPFGSVKIYNNTIIDSHGSNLMFLNPDEFLAVYIYNNSSILYDRPGSKHANMISIGKTWDIGYNHFWTKGGSPYVPSSWQANHLTTDPKLPGEPALDWDGLKGINYFYKIDFDNHLYFSSESNLANAGKTLGAGYNSNFLTTGTDFSRLKFQRTSHPNSAKWCIGAIIPIDLGPPPKPDYLPPPRDLTISSP